MMKDIKKIKMPAILLGAIILLLLFKNIVSFGSGIAFGYTEHKSPGTWQATYSYFSGTKTGHLQGDKKTIQIKAETDQGALQVVIKDDSGQQIFTKEIKEAVSFTVEVPEKIEVTLSASGHKGGFAIHY